MQVSHQYTHPSPHVLAGNKEIKIYFYVKFAVLIACGRLGCECNHAEVCCEVKPCPFCSLIWSDEAHLCWMAESFPALKCSHGFRSRWSQHILSAMKNRF